MPGTISRSLNPKADYFCRWHDSIVASGSHAAHVLDEFATWMDAAQQADWREGVGNTSYCWEMVSGREPETQMHLQGGTDDSEQPPF